MREELKRYLCDHPGCISAIFLYRQESPKGWRYSTMGDTKHFCPEHATSGMNPLETVSWDAQLKQRLHEQRQ